MTRRDILASDVLTAIRSGATIKELANKYGCSTTLIRSRLKDIDEYKPKAAKKAEHGTRTMYVHHGCRCDKCCKAEHEQYLKRKEAKARKRVYSKWGNIPKPEYTEHDKRRSVYSKQRLNAINSRPKAHAKYITWREIASVFNMTCAICGNRVNPDDKWINKNGSVCFGRDYPTVDHIQAIKNGGSDTFDNVQLTCKHCNSRKGVKSMEEVSNNAQKQAIA